MTADYFRGYAGTNSVTDSTAARYLTWAETDAKDAGAAAGAGIKTLEYLDPFRQAKTDPLYNTDEATFSHNCSGERISIDYAGGTSHVTQYLMDPGSSQLVKLLNAWEENQEGLGHVDAFFFDNVDDLLGTTNPCNVSDASWDADNASFIQASTRPILFSGYALSSEAGQLIKDSNVMGAMVEECYARDSEPTKPYTTGSYWTQDENLELAAAAAGKQYFCYNDASASGASAIPLRQYVYASFLLTYSSSSVLWETFATPSGLHVFPESAFVPASPRVAPGSSVGTLERSSGLYVREYAACYLAGKSVGRCAAIVNPDASASHPLPALSASYAHTLSIVGSGVLDGGSASATGAAPPKTIPPETGLIAIQ